MPSSLNVILVSTVIVIALLVGVALVDDLQSGREGIDSQVTRDAVLLSDTSTFVAFDDGKGTDETVYKTTGYAVNLTGANDSYVESTGDIQISADDTWTISVWASVAPGANTTDMTAVSANGRVVVSYNGTQGNWTAWYYDESSTDSYRVNVSATAAQPGTLVNVIVTGNSSTLAIYRNNTLGETEDVTASSIASADVQKTNWQGRLEEVRTFDDDANASTRQELVDSPVEQQPDVSPTARIMFDQPGASTQLLLYTSEDVRTSNVTYVSGFSEQVMQGRSIGSDILGTTDYVWEREGPKLRPTDGGELDGAPVAYADYRYDTALADVVESWGTVSAAASLIPMVLIGVVIIRILRGGT